jgi:hypothetical protein
MLNKKENKKINFVLDDDLEGVLKEIGVYSDFINRKKKCKFCKEIVSMDNLHSIFKESGDIKFICDKPICVKKLINYKN